MKDKDPKIDPLKNHPCGDCVWRSFTNGGVAGCFKTQKLVIRPCASWEKNDPIRWN